MSDKPRVALDLIPPKDLIHPGTVENFGPMGRRFVGFIIDLCGLSPDEKVLEVGCGIGRMALPLTGYLSERGSYDGFDTVKDFIQWCQDNITPRRPNFHFRYADIANTRYNPDGQERAETFTFPYDEGSFDLVFLASVFTHLLPLSFLRYLSESKRVLRPGGRILASFFLLNDESWEMIAAGKSRHRFPHPYGECWVGQTDIPEAVVGYEETLVSDLYRHVGLEIHPPIHYGSWPGRTRFLGGQDIIVATRPDSDPIEPGQSTECVN